MSMMPLVWPFQSAAQEVQDALRKWTGGTLPFPPCVERWLNVADRLDPVAFDNDISDDFDGATDRFLADLLDTDRLDGGIAPARLSRFGFRAAGRDPGQTHHSQSRNCSTHSLPIIRSRTGRTPV
jgi:hypothetical protein